MSRISGKGQLIAQQYPASFYIAFYNQQRLHSSLRYLPPAAFERQQAKQACQLK